MSSTYRNEYLNGRPPMPVDMGFFAVVQFDASDTLPNYIGMHVDKAAADADTNWKIYKYTYSGSAVTKIELAYGSWTNRVSLF